MRKSAVYKRGSGSIEFNMTPMIDVTFQLILFFIIAGQIASDALAKMQLAEPTRSQALETEKADVKNKVLVNVVSKADVDDKDVDPFLAGQAAYYQIGSKRIPADDPVALREEIERLRDEGQAKLKASSRGQADFFVEIRADRRVHYKHVEPVLLAAAAAGVEKMNITALLDQGD